MKLLFKGPVLITGGSSQLGMALARALREEGAETLSVCRSSEGLARCGEAGPCSLPLGEPESLPERCRGLFGEPPAHLVDLMHSRFESLIAGAAPEAIMEWAAVDIGLRARLVRAVGRSMLARRFGRCVFVSSSAAECPAEGQGIYAAAKAGWRGPVPEPCRGAVRKGDHRLFLAPELAGCRAGCGISGAQERGRRKTDAYRSAGPHG